MQHIMIVNLKIIFYIWKSIVEGQILSMCMNILSAKKKGEYTDDSEKIFRGIDESYQIFP